ncbi:S-adenosylmethionine carrier 1, chloroplastic/mitochondrial-like protein isoform X2, partial [Tanacetum coccineum]
RGGGQIVLKGLYSGFAGNLAGVLPYTAGSIGGAASSIIRVPTEVVTQRMQTEHFASAPVAVQLIVKGLFTVAYNDFVADGSLLAVREKGL